MGLDTTHGAKLKRCHKCRRELDRSEFHKDRSRHDGLNVRCRECESVRRSVNKARQQVWSRQSYERRKADGRPRRQNAILAKCHPDLPHCAKGLCGPCYRSHLRQNSPRRAEILERRAIQERVRRIEQYGIGADEYARLLTSQGGVCGICRQPALVNSRLHIDHDHQTGRVRGLLCHNCNRGLGIMGDTLDRMRAAVTYLESVENRQDGFRLLA
jgi:hypothetical protein